MSIETLADTTANGGWQQFPDRQIQRIFYRSDDRETKQAIIKSGQVIKALSFLQSDSEGKLVAHSGINEKALVTFPSKIDGTETVIIAGLTYTAGSNAVQQATLVSVWSGLPVGITAAEANTLKGITGSSVGTFTAGTLTGYSSEGSATAGSVNFVSTTPYAGVTDLTVTGTGDASSVAVTAQTGDPAKDIAGISVFDVDASGGDVLTVVYCEASFWADALVWSVDPAVDTITLKDGTTKACTEYNTGCTTNALKAKFVERSEFANLGFLAAGEYLQNSGGLF